MESLKTVAAIGIYTDKKKFIKAAKRLKPTSINTKSINSVNLEGLSPTQAHEFSLLKAAKNLKTLIIPPIK